MAVKTCGCTVCIALLYSYVQELKQARLTAAIPKVATPSTTSQRPVGLVAAASR